MGDRQPQIPALKTTNEVDVADQKKDTECGVCMVCYEDLKPVTENLQVITTCGHVFHQLCLQQWLEYSTSANNRTCPICRQTFRRENIRRLYFQSDYDGDTTDHSENLPEGTEEDEVKKLQGKLLGLTSSFEHQQQQLKDMSEELNKLKDTNKELDMCNEKYNKTVVYQQRKLSDMSEELNKLKDTNKELDMCNEKYNKAIVYQQRKLNDMSEELNEFKDMNADLSRCNEEKNKELYIFKDMNAELSRCNEEKKRELDKLKDKNEELSRCNEEKNRELNKLKDMYKELSRCNEKRNHEGVRQPQTPAASKITSEVCVADQKKDNESGVCMICYEDLKPVTENLQVITTCGHVFHQHCLLQWLDYSVANNITCPVCRQACRRENIRRLYFQSDGDTIDHSQSLPDTGGTEEDELKKLQGKLLGLTSSFEHQQQQLKDMSEELKKLNDMNKELTKCNEEKNKEINKSNDMNRKLTKYNEEKNKDIVFYKGLLGFFFLVTCCSMVYSIMK